MQRYRPIIVAIVLFGAGIGAAYWAAGWWNYLRARPVQQNATTPPPTGAAQPSGQPREEVVIQSPTVKHTEGGRLAWQVQLTELKIATGGQSVAAAGMREALIYDKNGAPILRITAQKARGNTSDRNLEVSGNVRAVSHRGALITTEQVRWLEKERALVAPQKVTFRSSNAAVTTIGLRYYVDQDLIKAPGIVRMYSGPNRVIGRQLVYDVKTQSFEMRNIQAFFNPEAARQMTRP